MNDTFEMQFLGGHQWEPIAEVKPHLVSEDTTRAGAGAIAFFCPRVQDVLEKV